MPARAMAAAWVVKSGMPAPGPHPPGLVAEDPVDGLEVVGEVVLGEEVDVQRAAHGVGEGELVGVERLASDEVTAPAPRHQLVGHPVLAAGQMPLQEGPD